MSTCKIIRNRQLVHHVEYRMDFPGFSFPMFNGAVVPTMTEAGGRIVRCSVEKCSWWENYQMCLQKYGEGEFTKDEWDYWDPAEAKCSCGKTIELFDQYRGACECPRCGQWYNLFGQSLVDPKYWEEDDDEYAGRDDCY